MALYFTEDDVLRLLPMEDAIAAVESAFRELGEGRASVLPRARVKLPAAMLHVLPAGIARSCALGVKAYTTSKSGTRFFYLHFDGESGELLAVMAADRLGQIRTGAASGVATRYLSREDSSRVGIIGTGWQARSQLEAVAAVRPVTVVWAFGRDPERRRRFCEDMRATLSLDVRPAESAEGVTREADIVVTATNARSPVLRGAWLSPGQHVNAVGSNFRDKQEVDADVVRRASVIAVDLKEQALLECGDLVPLGAGWSDVRELSDIVSGKAPGRERAEDVTLFESQGIALEDVAVAARVYEKGRALGVGVPLPF